jgi:cytochrome c oxidase assembly protein subunit 11
MSAVPVTPPVSHRRVLLLCAAIVLGMCCFVVVLIPMYNSFCKLTGLNGKIGGRVRIEDAGSVDTTRNVQLAFVTLINESMPWEFRPLQKSVTVHPGEIKQVAFYVKNMSDRTIVGQAIPSITPGLSAAYLKKTECFCFTQQTLKPHEERVMPVRFFIDKELPSDVIHMTLAYTLFDTHAPPPPERFRALLAKARGETA